MTDRPRRLSSPKSQNHIFSPLTPTAVVCRLLCQVSCAFLPPNVREWNFICVFPNLLKGRKKLSRKDVADNPQTSLSKSFPIFCCQKKIAGTFYLYWPQAQICLQGLYNMQEIWHPTLYPFFSYFNTTNQIPLASSVAIQIISFTYLPLKDSTTGKRELVVFFLVIYVN